MLVIEMLISGTISFNDLALDWFALRPIAEGVVTELLQAVPSINCSSFSAASSRSPFDRSERRLSVAEHFRDTRHELTCVTFVGELSGGLGHAPPLLFVRRHTGH